MKYIKEYFIKHRELFLGVTVVCLLDHFIFKGAFRERLQRIVNSVLDSTEKKLTKD